ncbi:hypothetical protein TWF694_000084 [Orbilia ellipsospora]|uniref:Proteophosphoglycan ppg4 n=1 Tax=Orbilia ellipsospora TaxID=2528407 RepID=A0AAV9XMZ2_9PEZI
MSLSSDPLRHTMDALEGREWKSKIKSGARLSVELFKIKQQPYDRRPSSVDATNWYSAGSSFSGASVSGAPNGALPMNSTPGGATAAGGTVNRRTSMVSSLIGPGGIATEDEEDRGEVTYTPARMSIVAGGGPSEACGGGHDPMQYRSQSESAAYGYNHARNSFQLSLIEKLYGYNQANEGLGSPLTKPQEVSNMTPRNARNTSVYRSFEGWGFNADEIHRMDPIEEKENDEPPSEAHKPFRFDTSISRDAYAAKDADTVMVDVDPLDPMDSASRSYIRSHPVPIPVKVPRKRSSQQYARDWRKRRVSSLQSAQGGQSRPHSRLHSNAKSTGSNGSISSSPYRPSIVLSEVPMFELSESEPPTRNVSLTNTSNRGSVFGKRGSIRSGSISNGSTRRSSKLSKKSNNSSGRSSLIANNGSYETPGEKKSFFSFLGRGKHKSKGVAEPTSEPRMREKRGSVDSNYFVPLLQDIAEVSSVSSRGHTPELMTATQAPLSWIRAPQPLKPSIAPSKPRMLPVRRPDYNVRKASIALRLEDDDVFDNPPPVVPHRERRRSSSSIYSQSEILAMKAMRKPSSIYEEDIQMSERYRRSSSVYDKSSSVQPGEEESPSDSPSPEWIYSESHMSHPDVYVPPRANWYKSEWGLNEGDAQEAEAVRVIVSKSRRGSVEEESIRMASISAGRRKSYEDNKMGDLSNALRDALKMNDILEEEYYA